jgi:hypothetical protein
VSHQFGIGIKIKLVNVSHQFGIGIRIKLVGAKLCEKNWKKIGESLLLNIENDLFFNYSSKIFIIQRKRWKIFKISVDYSNSLNERCSQF